jgi:lysophospholipase L1-like esterase
MESSLVVWYPAIFDAFEFMTGSIAGIRADCAQRGIDYLAFCIPAVGDIHEGAFQQWRQLSSQGLDYERGKAIRLTQRFLDEQGIPSIDVISPLESHPRISSLYYSSDGHLNAAGNRLVAETIAEALIREHGALLGLTEAH